jgi:hypothetical protein
MLSEVPSVWMYRAVIGVAISAVLTFSAPTLLEVLGPKDCNIFNILKWLILSPFVMLPMCIVYFLVERCRSSNGKGTGGLFALCLFLWAFAGLGIAVIEVIVLTIAIDIPEGPIYILFLGPVGFANGAVVGTGMWRLFIVKPNIPLPRGSTTT